jgi:hypothetical protein
VSILPPTGCPPGINISPVVAGKLGLFGNICFNIATPIARTVAIDPPAMPVAAIPSIVSTG